MLVTKGLSKLAFSQKERLANMRSLSDVPLLQRLIAKVKPAGWRQSSVSLEPFIHTIAASIRAQRLTLFVGAGASYANGFPTWAGLLTNLSALLVPKEQRRAFSELAIYDSPLVSARFLKSRLAAPDMFHTFVQEALYGSDVNYAQPNPTMNFIIALAQFASRIERPLDIITYNFDDLIETRAATTTPVLEVDSVVGADQYHNARHPIRVLHVHGALMRDPTAVLPPPRLVLAEDDFHRLMNDHTAWQNQAQASALAHRDCLFVGLSLADPNLRRLIDFSEELRVGGSPGSKWIVTRRLAKNDTLAPGAAAMSSITAAALNNIKTEMFKSLGADAIHVEDFTDYDRLASLVAMEL